RQREKDGWRFFMEGRMRASVRRRGSGCFGADAMAALEQGQWLHWSRGNGCVQQMHRLCEQVQRVCCAEDA
ncbi:hypothetical protein, partial [Xanthomonas phaseoli]|uniref:hypothetical protein n=1 Tax=Xanthomonas phaseoli TaxID=1985254 RepID=UPI001969E221